MNKEYVLRRLDYTIRRVLKKMNREKLKVFVHKDFNLSYKKFKEIMNLLINEKIIENVEVFYYCGVHETTLRKITGYRLIKNEN